MLSEVFPEHNWEQWRFTRVSKASMKDKEILVESVKKAEVSLNIKEPKDWYRVSMEQIRGIDLNKIFIRHGGLIASLKKVYPDMEWDEKLVQNAGHKKAGQRWLGSTLREFFPNLQILEEYVDDELVYGSNKPMRFDYFIPSLKLAFEFQGLQHFSQLKVYGDAKFRIVEDDEKSMKCNSLGISLFRVPFWWDRKRGSLLKLIFEARPDLKDGLSRFSADLAEAEAIPKMAPIDKL